LFVIYPSLPRQRDFQLAVEAAAEAFSGNLGQWQHGARFLLGYEYRMCIKLGTQVVTAKKGNERRRFFRHADFEANRPELEAEGWRFSLNAEQSPEEFVAKAFQRHCVDIESKDLVGRFRFDLVEPWKRMWIWHRDKPAELLDQLELRERDDLVL
jgi:hypothetical protein